MDASDFDLLQNLLASQAHDADVRRGAFNALAKAVRAHAKAGDHAATHALLARTVSACGPTLDFTSAQILARLLQAQRDHLPAKGLTRCRLALLGSATMDQFAALLELYAYGAGVRLEIYQAPYGIFRQEILDPGSDLYRFEPQIVFLATGARDLACVPAPDASPAQADACVAEELAGWQTLWSLLHERLGCQVLQNNFEQPATRALANHERQHRASLGHHVMAVNCALAREAPAHVTLHDLDELSARAGRLAWGDPRFFHTAKLPCAPEHLVDYAHSVASVVAASLGKARKCLVLDLDNTLWGGVIGDDGLAGIRIGQGGGEGEAYVDFQRYALALKERGVILAVCSKNDEANAREPFEKHPDMVLKLEDIACFVANWSDKASNLRTIAQTLNIGLDSLVFVDDNPAERSIVRQLVPEVAVPELSTDPSDYVCDVDAHRWFQTVSLEAEDLKRTGFYRANAQRDALASSSGDIESFLDSLQMEGRIDTVHDVTLERSTQLINKSNQFNLTTRRYTAAEVMARSRATDWCAVSVSLKDRFGDNGLIGVVMARRQDDAVLDIDTWLMSCRVLKRGVERYVLNHLAGWARRHGLRTLRGEYIPSAKNGMVARHYEGLGFTLHSQDSDGRTVWTLALDDAWQPLAHHIHDAAAAAPQHG